MGGQFKIKIRGMISDLTLVRIIVEGLVRRVAVLWTCGSLLSLAPYPLSLVHCYPSRFVSNATHCAEAMVSSISKQHLTQSALWSQILGSKDHVGIGAGTC